MLPIKQWFSFEEGEKNAEYANNVIRWVRTQMQPLVNVENARIGMNYLLGRQDMSPIVNLFQNPAKLNLGNRPVSPLLAKGYLDDPEGKRAGEGAFLQDEMIGVEFKPLPILEKHKNIIIAEMKKMGVVTNVRASDPTSTVARKNDEYFIKNKKEIEGLLSYIYTSIGQHPVALSEYKDRFGEKHDSGNTQDFEKMGLQNDSPDDIAFFMDNFHKLDWEIALQKVIDTMMSFNEVEEEKIEKWTTDLLAKKATAAQMYVSDISGALTYNYLTPETVYIYGGGRRKDYNDANAKCYQQKITIKEFLDRVGSAFDWREYLDNIILSVFTASNGAVDITGINPDLGGQNSSWFARTADNNTYSYNQFMQFKVLFGYMEWVAQDETEYGEKTEGVKGKKFNNKEDSKKNKRKGNATENTPYKDNQNPDGKKYPTKARYETPTYKAYYLAVTSVDHIMFDFGRVTYQDIEGYNDFNSNFTIITYKEIGDPISIMCRPMIDLINECWYKWKYEIRKAKPRGMNYNYDSLMTIARDLYQDTEMTEGEKFEKIISWRNASANGVWTFPIGADGKAINLTSAQLDIELANGLTPEVMRWWEIMVSTWDKMIDMVMGTANLRQGDAPGDRSSMNNEFKALEYSQNSTYYIPDTITFMCRQLASRTSMITQDIVQFKDYDTLAYKFLETMVGEDVLFKISGMGKKAMHRYGIFVESLNQAPKMAKLSARLDFALQNGKITNAEALLVEQIKSPNVAFITLAYFEQRNARIAQQNAMSLQQQQAQAQMAIEKQKEKNIMLEGNFMIEGKRIDAESNQQGHLITQQGGVAKAAMKHSSDVDQIYAKTDADIQRERELLNNTGKSTPPPIVPQAPMQGAPGGPPPQAQRPLSGIQQSMADAEPMATLS